MTKVHFKPIWIFRTSGHWQWTDEIKGHLVLNKISTMPHTLSLTASVFMWLTFHLGPPTCTVLRSLLTQSVAFRTTSWYFAIVCLFFTLLVAFSTLLYTFPKHVKASHVNGSNSSTVAASTVPLAFYTMVLQFCCGKLQLFCSNWLSCNHSLQAQYYFLVKFWSSEPLNYSRLNTAIIDHMFPACGWIVWSACIKQIFLRYLC